MKKLALVLLVSFTAIAATADTWMDDRGFTWSYSISGNEATITGISPKEGEMPPIPSELGGVPVTSIGDYAFDCCRGLTGTITIPNCVTNIGCAAFRNCIGLTGSLVIPGSVKRIGGGVSDRDENGRWLNGGKCSIGAFSGCSGFNGTLTLEYGVQEICEGAFKGCSGFIGALTIPDSVVRILGDSDAYGGVIGAFTGCSGFTGQLTLGAGVVDIGRCAFSGCSGFTGTLIIPDGVMNISGAFGDCTGIIAVYLPATVESVNGAFGGCVSLATISIADGSKVVGGFSGCTGLTDVDIPDSVTNIALYAFRNCTQLANLNLPASLKVISEGAFQGCRKLGKIEWPVGVTVGAYAFADCSSWQGVFTVPEGVTHIADGLFSGCSGLQQINLPNSVISIGSRTFSGCSSLTEMILPEGLTGISAGLFNECTHLSKVVIPQSVKTIGNQAFYYVQGLEELIIPEGVTSIDNNAFGFDGAGGSFVPFKTCTLYLPSTLVDCSPSMLVAMSGSNSRIRQIIFSGNLPVNYEAWRGINNVNVSFSRASGSRGLVTWPVTQFMGYTQENAPEVTIVSSKIRENDPEVLDVVYKVTSTKPTVKVRALAFEDGVRSFANVVRPQDFIADLNGNETSGNVGDAVTANEEHTLSWKVSSDWATRLAKVSFEVLATEDDILPLELMTIPGTASHPETWQVSWNYITADKSFEALLWLYADKDLGLTLQNGVLKNGDTSLCSGASVSAYDALVYIYGKMGFQLLDGDALSYVKEATRFNLPDKSGRQYAYRVVADE